MHLVKGFIFRMHNNPLLSIEDKVSAFYRFSIIANTS